MPYRFRTQQTVVQALKISNLCKTPVMTDELHIVRWINKEENMTFMLKITICEGKTNWEKCYTHKCPGISESTKFFHVKRINRKLLNKIESISVVESTINYKILVPW